MGIPPVNGLLFGLAEGDRRKCNRCVPSVRSMRTASAMEKAVVVTDRRTCAKWR
jgi:hypothetical protein